MEYACIGEHLKHSFSKEIHNELADYEYEIKEIASDELESFALKADFKAINVTIPYKELIMPYLYKIDEHASSIGAVNTVVNKNGKLYGYNTDFYGMSELIRHAGISVLGKKAAILGSGGTAKTATAVLKALGASEILLVSRKTEIGKISYTELYNNHADTEIIINTTPVGMFPSTDASPIDPTRFKSLSGVIDAVYNPLRTTLISRSRELGIPAEGGLYMLVAQAVRASEIFLDTKYPEGELERVYSKILRKKENIVLIGMPSSGKTTLGRQLSFTLGRELYDSDEIVSRNTGMEIKDIFSRYGETKFRQFECDAISELSLKNGSVISTGGGAILNRKNIFSLKKNGILIFLDRDLEDLVATSDRPLSSDRAALEKRYYERLPIYKSVADITLKVKGSPAELAKKLEEILENEAIYNKRS